jgi:adenosylcobyric acid synthase
LLVVGATSGAGKSTIVSALCRAWSDRGLDVVPFKAQNMSNHAAVTPDGGEIGRAQAMQALAARVETDRRMNPVLLKPAGGRSHVVVLGDEVASTDAAGYGTVAAGLRATVLDALTGLRREHDWVVAEGAGGAAEINLLDRDLVNLPLAAAAGLPAVLVVDIDRGGAFASAYGTLALLPDRLRATVRGIVLNSFRGDASLLAGGIAELERRTGVPVLGVLPHLGGEPMLGVEDYLDLGATFAEPPPVPSRRVDAPTRPSGSARVGADAPLRVAVVRLPHLANPADLDPLVLEPSVALRWATAPHDLLDADLVVLPGSRATVTDLAWLRSRGLDDAIAAGRTPVLGICAGYQMLGRVIHDDLESGAGTVAGLGLLPVVTTFARPKTVRRSGRGYEIRWGRPVVDAAAPDTAWLTGDGDGAEPEGCRSADGRVRGTSRHGLLDDDDVRRELLSEVADRSGRSFTPAPLGFAAARDAHLDRLARWLEAHVDVEHLRALASGAVAPDEAPGW